MTMIEIDTKTKFNSFIMKQLQARRKKELLNIILIRKIERRCDPYFGFMTFHRRGGLVAWVLHGVELPYK